MRKLPIEKGYINNFRLKFKSFGLCSFQIAKNPSFGTIAQQLKISSGMGGKDKAEGKAEDKRVSL